MRALLAKLKGLWLFVRYIEEFAKNHVRKNEGQLYSGVIVWQSHFKEIIEMITLIIPL